MNKKRNLNWLMQVEKPARYTGDELNIIRKRTAGKLRFALCFPDVYEVGMSHLGSRILYEVLNSMDDVYCERCYAPWIDAEARMRESGIRLYALETGEELAGFDVLGFPLLYEMSYTNILNMLDMAGLPLRVSERDESHPLVVAGGPCACNSEPVAPFIDVIMLGDGEKLICELAQAVNEAKRMGAPRAELLLKLADIPGCYVPSLYDVHYNTDGTVHDIVPKAGAPMKVRRRILADLDAAPYPTRPIVPYTSIVHDRAVLEVFRGCTRGCRFCQAGYIYRPVRERSSETLLQQARDIIDSTGYEEISLTSLSSGDYSQLDKLIAQLGEEMDARRVSLALPSLRIDSFQKSFAEGVGKVRKSSLTFAPEAGTQRLRNVINKGVDEADLLRSVRSAFQAGYDKLKLYFMIGLPTETDEDIMGIAGLTKKVIEEYYAAMADTRSVPTQVDADITTMARDTEEATTQDSRSRVQNARRARVRNTRRGVNVNVSVSPFVPKPFTPFQWEAQDSITELTRKQNMLKDAFRGIKHAKLSTSNPRLSAMEAVFSRGDRRVAAVIERAFRIGARMDGWSELFDYELWLSAFEAEGISPAFYAIRQRGESEMFPYDMVDVGVTRDFLISELEQSLDGVVTDDCRRGCHECGLEDEW